MLVLRRRQGESLLIGDNVEVQILELTSQAVKLGIIAPKEISILRKELYLTRMENEAAAREVNLEKLSEFLKKHSK